MKSMKNAAKRQNKLNTQKEYINTQYFDMLFFLLIHYHNAHVR